MNSFKKFSFLALLALILTLFNATLAQAADPNFGDSAQFRNRWLAQDRLVGTAGVNRPYTWGPNVPNAPVVLSEPYNSSPGGQRRVLYLDKARMEINNPANGFVTTGLAVKELVSGSRQDGDTTFKQLQPSRTQVAGDAVSVNPDAPVYASFRNVVTLGNADSRSKPAVIGSVINTLIDKNGATSQINPPEQIRVGAYEGQTGHNIAAPFEDFKNQRGPITDVASGATLPNELIYTDNPTSNVFGLAISEPYWVRTRVAGRDLTVLLQLFERRVLTYNPALSSNRVEMGNLGQHYYQWRYVESGDIAPVVPNQTELSAEEAAFLNLINNYRKDNGKPALTINKNLQEASRWMSNDMSSKDYLAHKDSMGRDAFQRMAAFGYVANTYKAENIAGGYRTAQEVFEGWRTSPGHNSNMLDSNLRVIGIAMSYNASSVYKWLWTTDFGGQ